MRTFLKLRPSFLSALRRGVALLLAFGLLCTSGCAYSTMHGVSGFDSDEKTRAKLLAIFPVGTSSAILVEGLTERTGEAPAIREVRAGYLEGAIVTTPEVKKFIRVPISGSNALISGETRKAYFELDGKGRLVRITFTRV